MNIENVNKEKKMLHILTSENHLLGAFSALADNARKSLCYNVLGKLESLEYSYNSLLNYYSEGYDDPQRDQVHRSICESLHNLIDDWADELIFTGSTSQRAIINASYSIDSIEMLLQEYAENKVSRWIIFDEIFNIVWAIKPGKETPIMLESFILNNDLLSAHREALVGGIFLQIMQRFSAEYVELLFNLVNSKEERLSARALVSLMFSIFMYHQRIMDNPRLMARLDAFLEDEKKGSLAFSVLLLIEQSRLSGKIEDAMNDQIIPELLKFKDKFANQIDGRGRGKNWVMEISSEKDWDEMFNESPKLQSHLEKLNDWQLQGVDIFFPTFRHLKNYRFFDRLSAWIMPFTMEAPEIVALTSQKGNESSLMGIIEKTNTMCDSDKYSVIFSFGGIPFERKDVMVETYKIELEASEEMEQEKLEGPSIFRRLAMANHYIHDLYRLFHLNRHKAEFEDIFADIPSFYEIPLFEKFLPNDEAYETLADFFVKLDLHDCAAKIFEDLLSKSTRANALLMRKTAFCHLKAENYQRALELFLNADLAQENHIWTKRKIAQCYHKLGKFASELFYLQQADKLAENNYQIKFSIGECLMSLNRYDDALKYFFEIHYNAPDDADVIREIVVCEFRLNKLDEAQKYFGKLDAQLYNMDDYILLGHINLCQNKRSEAISAYRKSLVRGNEEIFLEKMARDEEYLSRNVGSRTVAIMIDTIIRR